MLRFVEFLRFVLFMSVGVGLPAFVIGTIINGVLGACTQLAGRSRILLSGSVGLGFFYTMSAVAANALKLESGFLISSGFVLITAVSFIVIDICAARIALFTASSERACCPS